jgi:serine/threonine-protein kinase
MDDASQSQSGYIAGTPQYMAPEQARGDAIDARADLFSLGSVMYAMCAGHPPFRAETTLAVLRRICDDTPRDLREANPDVPPWLAGIVHRLLAKSPDERFQSADEVADHLERWLAHLQQPTIIPPPAFVDPEAAKRSINRRWWIALAASAAVLLVGAVIAWQIGLGTRPADRSGEVAVVKPFDESGAQTTSAAAATDTLPAVDAELQQAWQETMSMEAALSAAAGGGIPIEQELGALTARVEALEWELAPKPRAPAPTLSPSESVESTSN